jgi:ParB-like chromosome segregation protein Spo0J
MTKQKTPRPKTSAETDDGENGGRKPTIHMLDVLDLRPHPRQAELVGDMPPAEYEPFAADIAANGIRDPLVVMADRKTLICGHQRTRAALQNKITTVPCIIRDDLHDPDDPAVIELLLGDNLHRRHLSKLQQALCAIKLAEIECDRQNKIYDWERNPRIEKSVKQRLCCSLKSAQRYIAVARNAVAIQEALDRKLLKLVDAAGIANLPKENQERLAASVSKLLREAEEKGMKSIKQKIGDLVQAAFKKTRRPKRVPAPSPVDTLRQLKAFLDGYLPVIRENKTAIIADLRGDDFGATLRASPAFPDLYRFRSRIVKEVQETGNSLLGELADISNAIEPGAEAGGSVGAGENDSLIEGDEATDTVSPS